MCTAIRFQADHTYFGRTLDLDFSYHESVIVTPRNFPFPFRHRDAMHAHFAIIGAAHEAGGYPLYYDAVNEKGLGMAGLNFPRYAYYQPQQDSKKANIAVFELIPWLLGQCENLTQVRTLLGQTNIVDTAFSPQFPPATLHWLIGDKEASIVVEATAQGIQIYDNPADAMANAPYFDYHLLRLHDFMQVHCNQPESRFNEKLQFNPYALGLGAYGLPGDYSSPSRFVKAAFVLQHSTRHKNHMDNIAQFFHIMDAVAPPHGCVLDDAGKAHYTVYTSCCDMDEGVYYYTTHQNPRISAVDMRKEDLNSKELKVYPMVTQADILYQN